MRLSLCICGEMEQKSHSSVCRREFLSSRAEGRHFQLCHEGNDVPGLLCLFEQKNYLKLLRQFTLCKLNFALKSHGHIPGSCRGNKAAEGKPSVTPGAGLPRGAGQVFHVRQKCGMEGAQGISSFHSQAQNRCKVTYWDFIFFFFKFSFQFVCWSWKCLSFGSKLQLSSFQLSNISFKWKSQIPKDLFLIAET